MNKTEKVQKLLAKAGLGSRREMESVIEQGRVSVNGTIISLGERANEEDKIRVDGRIISIPKSDQTLRRVLMYNKPEGVVCTRKDPEGRRTVFNDLPNPGKGRWIAVGRLDLNTSGLLLFTNDGELANRLTHPSYQVVREYAVRVNGEVTKDTLATLKEGVMLEDGEAKFERVFHSGGEGFNQWYQVTLKEGRNREVRRIWEAVGCQVSRLIRVRYGTAELERRMARGEWREMDLNQVRQLEELVELPKSQKSFIKNNQDQERSTRFKLSRKKQANKQTNPRRTQRRSR